MSTHLPASVPSRRSFLRLSALGLGAAALGTTLAGCASGSSAGSRKPVGSSLDEIAALAKKEGKVQLIALPDTWANYKGQLEKFRAKYGIETPVASPDASSAEEVKAVKTLLGQSSQPDSIDIGYSFTKPATEQGLIEAYKPSNFDRIPDNLKDPNGLWVGAYYGVVSIGVNTKAAPRPASFEDLKRPEYKGKVALPGDPRTGATSLATVFAAALAYGGSTDDITPGIEYFADLAKRGNLVNISKTSSALASGQAAVVFDWNYNFTGMSAELKRTGVDLEFFVPAEGVFGTYYVQPVTKASPQPNAARLWVDWLTSDEGAEQYALGGAVPARFTELAQAGKLSKEAMANLPDPEILRKVTFPTVDQGAKANKLVTDTWAAKVRA
ncbi:ABC transporter substrate-binding protein [Kitasatospora sp. NPDC048298]|uniref:ABC transporter substrate-binding protein n=1 Tax=Kitasatospora sp. NPDC048298 TaxID=3364049 RepID=UPI0037237625